MTAKNSKKSPAKYDTLATHVARFGGSKKGKTEQSVESTLSFLALNDFFIIKEDDLELTRDTQSGLTNDVIDALKTSKIVLPETAEFFAEKFPFRGTVISKGPKTSPEVKVGDRVQYARLGGDRWVYQGVQHITINQAGIHAIIT